MRIVTLLILLFLSGPALAANASKNFLDFQDGPAGCGWRATVTDVHPGDTVVIDLSLLQLVGTCMYKPGPCGTKGDLLSVPVSKDDLRGYRAGEIIKVWVSGKDVSFGQPECRRTPG